jgi:hypothetical protein
VIRARRIPPLAVLAACGANPPAAPPPATRPPGAEATAVHAAAAPPVAAPHVAAHVSAASRGEWEGPPLAPPDSADYAVYAAVLRAFARDDESFFVLMDSTHVLRADRFAQVLVEDAFRKFSPEAGGIVGRLFIVNGQPYPLQPALPLEGKYRLMPETEFRALFGLGPEGPFHPHPLNGWAALRDRHRGSLGPYAFSRVAYDWRSRTALVFFHLRCGNICEQSRYVVLRRREGGPWKVSEHLGVYSDGDDHSYETHGAHGMGDTVVASIPQGFPPARDSTP